MEFKSLKIDAADISGQMCARNTQVGQLIYIEQGGKTACMPDSFWKEDAYQAYLPFQLRVYLRN